MVKVISKGREQDNTSGFVTSEDIVKIIESNRARIRNLGAMILTVCGLLLSTSFVVLFFVLTNDRFHIPRVVPILLFTASASLTISIICCLSSALLSTPSAIATKLELINVLTVIYNREYRRSIASATFLLVAILLRFSIECD